MSTTTPVKHLVRRGTTAQWTTANPILFDGEIGYESDTKVFRVGDGVTAFLSLQRFATYDDVVAARDIAVASAVPTGGIIMWSGAVASIPVGWVLCNGSNGTPDLRDRFVVGAGGDYAVGAVGGANAVTLTEAQMPSHTHTGNTDTSGAHSHTYSRANQAFTSECCGGLGTHAGFSTVTTSTSGAHSHSFTTAGSGGDGAHENRPPYYALAYIMKV